MDTLSSAGASDVEPDPNDLCATQVAEIMSQRTGRPVDDDMEALRRNFATLRAEYGSLSEQVMAMFRKSRRTDERLAALERHPD